MKIKHKIRLGFGLIIVIVLFAGALSIYFIDQLSDDAKVVLKNNYETLSFAREMRTVIDDNSLPLSDAARSAFNKQLVRQEHNVTEKGEDAATASLRNDFNTLQSPASTVEKQQKAEHEIRVDLRKIEELNMQAIVHKTEAAQASVNNATLILGLIGCFAFLALFSFSVNVGGFIAEPLITLTDALNEISRKNFDHRLNFSKTDEFAEVATAFNHLASRMKEMGQHDLTEIFAEKQRIETIIEHVHDAIIVLSEKQEILFINTAAQNLLKLHDRKLTGKLASQFTDGNKLFKSIVEDEGNISSLKIAHEGKDSLFQLESMEVFVPNVNGFKTDEVNIARLSAGKVYILRNLSELHEI